MINIQLFHSSANLLSNLSHHFGGVDKVTVITPNPNIADIARTKLKEVHAGLETVTIARFLRDELKQLLSDEELTNFQGKSELNLLLGSLWKMGRANSSYELFKRSFQMLTDFRSFTLNEDILKTVLEEYEEELGGAVFWFHKILSQMDIIDEHRSYFMLAERIRMGDLPPLYENDRTLVFWGFDFLTGSQVDMLNALAIRNDVFIPFPALAYEKSTDLDWIKWLVRSEAEIEYCDEKKLSNNKIKVLTFPKNYLAKSLKTINSLDTFKDKSIDYILGTKNLKDEFASEIPFGDISYKISVDLFKEKSDIVSTLLSEYLEANQNIHNEALIEYLIRYSKEVINVQDFRLLKTVSVVIETIRSWVALSENNETIGEFDLKIIMDSARLDLPRNSLFSTSNQENKSLRFLKTLEKNTEADLNILCVTSDYGPIKGSVVQYSENVEQFLASIGPVRRSELEFLTLKAKIQELLLKPNTFVLIENSILKHDLGWSSIIPEEQREEVKLSDFPVAERNYLFPENKEKVILTSISATRLQTYIDCPRKYYFNYILNQNPRIELPGSLNLLQLGLIEHKVIEEYLQRNQVFDHEILNQLILSILLGFEEEGKLQSELKEEYLLEVTALCTEVIKELLIINKTIGLKIRCEAELPNTEAIKVRGSIDCFGENENTLLILDFKRGGGSIPSQVGLKEFKKIQLWFYLERMKKNNKFNENTKLIWGYVNLSKLEESLIYCSDDNLIQNLAALNLKMMAKIIPFDDEFVDLLMEYSALENNTIQALNSDIQFSCIPKEPLVCKYCKLNNICPRSEVANGQS